MVKKEKSKFFPLLFPCLDKHIFTSTSGFIVLTNITLKHSSINALYFLLFLMKCQQSWTFISLSFYVTVVDFAFSPSKYCFSLTSFHLTPLSIWNIHKNGPLIIHVKAFLIWNVDSPPSLNDLEQLPLFLCIGFIRVIDASTISCKQRRNCWKKIR